MQPFCLTLSRLLLAGWVGGAALFVVTSVAEQRWDGFDALTKNTLALIRFPWYYTFGFTMLATGLGLGIAGLTNGVVGFARRLVFVVATSAALLVMLGDLLFVYLPLSEMAEAITNGDARPAEFREYHERSKQVNVVVFGLSLLSAILVSVPTWEPEDGSGR